MIQNVTEEVLDTIPSQEVLEKRFLFINNRTLRTNIAISFKYIIYLLLSVEKFELTGTIKYSIFKDVILYTASIVESCIHYAIKELIESGQIKSSEIMPWEWKDETCTDLYLINDCQKVCGTIRHKKPEKLTNLTQFKSLNEAARNANILNETLFTECEDLRKKRNHIHLSGLEKVDDYYTKNTVDSCFEIAKKTLESIESMLKKSL